MLCFYGIHSTGHDKPHGNFGTWPTATTVLLTTKNHSQVAHIAARVSVTNVCVAVRTFHVPEFQLGIDRNVVWRATNVSKINEFHDNLMEMIKKKSINYSKNQIIIKIFRTLYLSSAIEKVLAIYCCIKWREIVSTSSLPQSMCCIVFFI